MPPGVPFFGVFFPNIFPGRAYYWEGRTVIGAGESLIANALEDGWSLEVTGYQFHV